MLTCHAWLSVDFFVRAGFALEPGTDGTRTAVRGSLRVVLPAECGHDDCPPHEITTEARDLAA